MRTRRVALAAALASMLGADAAAANDYTAYPCTSGGPRLTEFAVGGMSSFTCGRDRIVTTGNDRDDRRIIRNARAEVAFDATPGTQFTSLKWSGRARRADCRYALQMWAEGPNSGVIPIFNLPANEGCPKKRRAAQVKDIVDREVPLNGATRIVQRVTCAGPRRRSSCSDSRATYLRSTQIAVQVEDVSPPAVRISTLSALARGEWVRGSQGLNYEVDENVGLTGAGAYLGHNLLGSETRNPCYEQNQIASVHPVPVCRLSGGSIGIDTAKLPDGSHGITVNVVDIGGNYGISPVNSHRKMSVDRHRKMSVGGSSGVGLAGLAEGLESAFEAEARAVDGQHFGVVE